MPITVFTRVIHIFNQNFVSKFRVRDLCEETILPRFIMKIKCDNQWENATIYSTETYSGPLCIIAVFLRTIVLLWFTFFIHILLSLPQSIVLTFVQRIGNSSLQKTCNNYALIHHVPCPHYPGAHQFNRRRSYLSSWCQIVSPFSHPLCVNYAMAWITRVNTVFLVVFKCSHL